ncbi:hypothetical protein BDV40DRAFT_289896 [Aspergillus tamarii]|uniref:NAD(P)-binding protein n=1 Tax=Aspergillus tamarii TaxID=41984 RepID=A0A5N6UPU9_ASPTM|nr:hypothetical protein BDV40DRAFT_289896 [Aspergillus tamarii]
MPYSLKGRNVLVTAGSRGLGALVCEKFAAEGANVLINYHSNAEAAQQLADKLEKEYSVNCHIAQADTLVAAENDQLVHTTVEKLGGLDIIIANAGWTRFTRPGDIYDMSHDEWNKCWAANVMSHLQLMQTAQPIMSKNPDGGVYIATSSIAGITTGGSSMAYSVTKAAGLHLMKHFAFTFGPEIRVNAVLPGLLLTEWGMKFGDNIINALKERSTLRHETYLDDCADAYISLAKNTSATGQQLTVDAVFCPGGISSVGRSSRPLYKDSNALSLKANSCGKSVSVKLVGSKRPTGLKTGEQGIENDSQKLDIFGNIRISRTLNNIGEKNNERRK